MQVHCANILRIFYPKSGNRQFLSFCPLASAGRHHSTNNYNCPHFVIHPERYCKLFRPSYEFFMNPLLTNRDVSCIIRMVTDCLQDSRFFLTISPSNSIYGFISLPVPAARLAVYSVYRTHLFQRRQPCRCTNLYRVYSPPCFFRFSILKIRPYSRSNPSRRRPGTSISVSSPPSSASRSL